MILISIVVTTHLSTAFLYSCGQSRGARGR